jgi:hypothetical protein
MNSAYSQTTLICPYTLMEEEALTWSIILFNQALLLHPFPLPLPVAFQPLVDQGWLQVRSPDRSQEEIRIKDKSVREVQAFIAGKPDLGFLKYLKEVSLLEERETQEEIVGLLKGHPSKRSPRDTDSLNGHILLCLIHEWIMQEWVIDAALTKIEEQEKNLAQGWLEGLEEELIWNKGDSRGLKRNQTEIPCPLALKAWKELKNQLSPGPSCLFTNQTWVWENHYGTDWEEGQAVSISLPDLSSSNADSFRALRKETLIKKKMPPIQEAWKRLLDALFFGKTEALIAEFQKNLSSLDLPDQGRYKLILPLFQPSQEEPTTPFGRGDVNPLILITN